MKKIKSKQHGDVALIWFTDDNSLGIETCRSVQSDTVIQIFKAQYCAFFWSECCELVMDNARNEQYKV
jgi:hypothetical protein